MNENKPRNNNNKKKGDPRSAYSYPIRKGMDGKDPNNPGKQNHLLAQLKEKYGPDFVGFADVYREFNNGNKIDGLIRTIFSKKFNFDEYGHYLSHPTILGKLIERAMLHYQESVVHFTAVNTMVQMYREGFSNMVGVAPNDISVILARDQALMTSWAQVYDALMQVNQANLVNPNGLMNYMPIKMKVGVMDTKRNNFGTPLNRVM